MALFVILVGDFGLDAADPGSGMGVSFHSLVFYMEQMVPHLLTPSEMGSEAAAPSQSLLPPLPM